MRTAVTCIVDAALRARLRTELHRDVRIEEVRSPGALPVVARQVGARAVIVELPTDCAGAAAMQTALQDVRRCAPEARRVVVCHFTPGVSEQATAVVRTDAGVLVLHPVDDVITVTRRELGISTGDSVTQQLLRDLVPALSVSAQSLVRYVILHADSRITVPEFARAMQRDPRTLQRWCDAARLPTPARLIAWGRVLVVLQLVASRGLTLERAALAGGFGGARPLRRCLQRLCGLTPSQIRNQGGHSAVFLRRFGAAPRTARAEQSLRIDVVHEPRSSHVEDAAR